MKRTTIIFAFAVAILAAATPATAQDLLTRLKQIEDNNTSIACRLATLESKVDAIAAKLNVQAVAAPVRAAGAWACANGVCQWVPAEAGVAVTNVPTYSYNYGYVTGSSSGGLFSGGKCQFLQKLKARRAARRGAGGCG